VNTVVPIRTSPTGVGIITYTAGAGSRLILLAVSDCCSQTPVWEYMTSRGGYRWTCMGCAKQMKTVRFDIQKAPWIELSEPADDVLQWIGYWTGWAWRSIEVSIYD